MLRCLIIALALLAAAPVGAEPPPWMPGRVMSGYDFLANALGVALVALALRGRAAAPGISK